MKENFIIDMLILNHVNYQKFGDQKFYDSFELWMHKLKAIKGFESIEEACDYYLYIGEQGEQKGISVA